MRIIEKLTNQEWLKLAKKRKVSFSSTSNFHFDTWKMNEHFFKSFHSNADVMYQKSDCNQDLQKNFIFITKPIINELTKKIAAEQTTLKIAFTTFTVKVAFT